MINKLYILLFILVSFVIYPQEKNSKTKSLFFSDTKSVNDTIRINKLFDSSQNYIGVSRKTDSLANLILQLSKKNNYQKGLGYYYMMKAMNQFGSEKEEDYYKALQDLNSSNYYFKNLKNKSLYIKSHYYIAICYIEIGQLDKGKRIALEFLEKYKKSNYFSELSKLNFFMGSFYLNEVPDPNESIRYLIKANYYANKIGDIRSILRCNSTILNVYRQQENWEKFLYYSQLSEKYVSQLEKKEGIPNEYYRANYLTNLATSNLHLGRYKTSLFQSKKAYAIGIKINDNYSIRYNLFTTALNYYYLGEYDLALKYSKKLTKEHQEPQPNYFGNYVIGKCKYKLHKYKEARAILEYNVKMYPDLVSNDFDLGPFSIYKDLSAICTALKDYQSAHYYLELYANNKINLLQVQNKNNTIKIAELYNSKNLEIENKQLYKSKKERELELQMQKEESKLSRTITLFFLILLVIVIFILIKIKKINNLLHKSKTELENSKELLSESLLKKNVLLKEIHHRVKNNLQLIISLQNIMVRRNKLGSVSDFLATGHSRINAMALIHESLYQNYDIENVDIYQYINKLIAHTQNIDTNNNVAINVCVDKINLSLDTALPLGLIINELITNSYKHAFPKDTKGMINISIEENVLEKSYLLIYSDTGIPYGDEIIKKEKFGLELVHLLIKQLKGELVSFTKEKKEYLIKFKNVNKISDTKIKNSPSKKQNEK